MRVFSIEVDTDGKGLIRIGDFCERFEISLGYWVPSVYRQKWREALQRFVGGSPAVGSVTWMIAPGEEGLRRAWILYREDEKVFVQEKLFVPTAPPAQFDEDEHLVDILASCPRCERSEDGERFSQWETNIASIRQFIEVIGQT